ncbi:catecholate siderophore receptor Fiu [Massilia arenosa]|uniref:Catecholate siderophore receptor Fiu n=1 Tax=Zemynaea arenosa TaxID=2561931 RepID=A0A4Y9SAV0_9BURK|nr:catecholate siderophore receptor Fiu [Massilia arenosa]TFW16718.1 catecholate siderophore receptor Fiu [Massilia arenosa]
MAIVSRKHAQPRYLSTALAAVLLPAAAHAGDVPPPALDAGPANEVKVVGAADNPFKATRASSSKYTEDLVNTAQSVTVIKKELIEQQGALTLTEALRNTPGVGTFFLGENGNTNTGDSIYMRGFDSSANIYVDGLRDIGSISRDTFNVEQIDVLKGPAGTDTGRGAPTGSINLVSKRANMEESLGGSVSAGTGSHKRITADMNHVLDTPSGTALRLNLMAQDSGRPGRDVVHDQRWAFAPSAAFGLATNTRFYVNYLHVEQDNTPDGGVFTIGLPGYTSPDVKRPFIANGPKVDPHNFYGSATDYDRVTADMATIIVEHEFSPRLRLSNVSRYGKTEQAYVLTSFLGSAANIATPNQNDPNTWTLARTNRNVKDQSNQITANQTTLTAELGSGTVTHTVVGGLEFVHEQQSTIGHANPGVLEPANIYHPNPSAPVSNMTMERNGVFADSSSNVQSLYVFDTMHVGAQWIFNAGVRADHFNIGYDGASLSTATSNPGLPVGTLVPTNLKLADTIWTGKLSALYKPTGNSSVYALIANSKNPPGSNLVLSGSVNSASNPKFDPQVTVSKEIGAKLDLLKQKLAFTAALYQTDVKNEVEQDPTDLQYYQTGKKRVRGIEIGLTGQFAKGWLVSAGYTRMDATVESGKNITQAGSNALSYTPKSSFTAWTSYDVTPAFKIGGGARYVGGLLRGTDGAIGTPAYTDPYWVIDGMASYEFSKKLSAQLNVYNLADKDYVASINKSGYRYNPGAPRSVQLTLNFKY